ncbi:2-keto-4-pentenoate hydratase [Roseomonas sp. CCTCC AB2023176]|uniref:2-keto-4-pentenoate hydratase n=1 Tax=Roseomonas sp. CCTCC AB2023176 TaxID=3342640 RepID=UPI0035E3AF94
MTDAVAEILAARRDHRNLDLAMADRPADLEAAYALQRRLAREMGEDPPAGWKIGATTTSMQAYLGLTHPCAGFTPRTGLRDDHGEFRFADYVKPGVECEIGLRLRHGIAPGRHGRDALADAVEHVFAAIEVVDQRYGDFASLGAPTLIADQVFHAGGVMGHPASGWPGIDLAAARGFVSVDGAVRAEGVGADLLGHPLDALGWLADSGAAHAFGGLRAGQVVFLGSVTPPIWLDGPCRVSVSFEPLGEVTASFA